MMSRLVKIVDNKYVQIEEHRNPNICFNTIEYDNFEDYCTLRETFDPFEMFYENKQLKEDISFCLHSIKQEMKMSTDSRTRNEMTSCYEILKRWNK